MATGLVGAIRSSLLHMSVFFSLLFLTLMVNHVLVLLGRDDVPTLYFVLVFYSSLEEINVFAYLRSIMGMTESIWTG